MSNNIVLESLAMDLKRVASGLHRKSPIMARRFTQEALARKAEIDGTRIEAYISRLLIHIENLLVGPDTDRKEEDAMMYSTLLQNYARKRLQE